ncbi:TPA: YlcI/YnfO family protein [Enterobacter hormaechei]
MATGSVNNKSKQVNVRVPHEVLEEIESVKNNGESTAGFLITAAIGEIKRRQRKKARSESES